MKKMWLAVLMFLTTCIALVVYQPYFTGIKGADALEAPNGLPYLEPDVQPWQAFLARVVDERGLVSYEEACANRALLQAYLDQVARATPEAFPSEPHRLAFYINAYNALVIDGVLRHYPISGVGEVGPMHRFFRERSHTVAGIRVSLHGLETRVLRRYDPLMHFALNCASQGCPPLAGDAYTAEVLPFQLERAAKRFLADGSRNRFDPGGRWSLSELFSWYAEDFGGEQGVIELVRRYGPEGLDPPKQIDYLPYDWSLNSGNVIK